MWLSGLLTVILLVSTKETRASCSVAKISPKDNANAPSNIYLDIVDHEIPPFHCGCFVPRVCLVPLKKDPESIVQSCKTELSIVETFKSECDALLQHRDLEFHQPFYALHKKCAARLQTILKKTSLKQQQVDAIYILFRRVSFYRLLTERVIFSEHQHRVNCDEQAARAYMNELWRATYEGWPKKILKKLHVITLHSRDTTRSHVFLVAGSSTLKACHYPHCITAVKNILGNMQGTVIDYWNNPKAGGVRMRADKARKRYKMYGHLASTAWDSIAVAELPACEIHEEIMKMQMPEAVRACLLDYAGPRLEEIMRGLPLLSERLYDDFKLAA